MKKSWRLLREGYGSSSTFFRQSPILVNKGSDKTPIVWSMNDGSAVSRFVQEPSPDHRSVRSWEAPSSPSYSLPTMERKPGAPTLALKRGSAPACVLIAKGNADKDEGAKIFLQALDALQNGGTTAHARVVTSKSREDQPVRK
jgi:hypothetical protein